MKNPRRFTERVARGLLYFSRLLNKRLSHAMAPGTRYEVPCGPGGASISLRAGTHDVDIWEQIFLYHDCKTELGNVAPEFVIDAGAHVGCSAMYFALRYPRARIIAVEAERRNFEMLRNNMRNLQNVSCVNAAVWGSHASLTLSGPAEDSWAFRVESAGAGGPGGTYEVPCVTIDDLLALSANGGIDLLKLDIEGAELDVFSADCSQWLSRTRAIMIELHDRFQPGCTEAFERAIGHYSFKYISKSQNNVTVARLD
jgi:FkbM family methyltransferase